MKGNGGDEELYADLLKDDIITLDDSLLCATHNQTPVIMHFSEAEKYTQSPTQTEMKALSTVGIKFKKQELNKFHINIAIPIFLLIIFVACVHVVIWW